MSYFDSDRLKQFFFIIIILLLGGILFWKITGFIPAFLGALTLYVVMRPAVIYLVYKKHWKRWITALLLMLASVIVLMVPMALIVNMMASKVSYAVSHSTQLIDGVKLFIEKIKFNTHIDFLSAETIQKIQDALTKFLPQFLGTTFNVLTTLVIMYFVLYFMLAESLNMEDTLYEYSPLKEENTNRLGAEIKSMVISNAIAIPLLAVVQAIFCTFGYWIFGVQDPVFWGVITGFMGMVPVVGTAIVWIPLGIFQIANGHTGLGIGLLIYGALIVGSADNVFRFLWQKKFADVHPLITVFGVLIGVSLFGFVGLIFGPLLISIFILLLRIYRDEFGIKRRRIKPANRGEKIL
ncbi:MAG: AI-2E family transporter [Chitinophagaceae bacterium]